MASNRFAVRNENECIEQLTHLYGTRPVKTGCSRTHQHFYVSTRLARLSKTVKYRNSRGDAMFMVEVQ